MLAKLSSLALFLTYVFALGITAPDSGFAGDTVPIDFAISDGDPAYVDLLLFDINSDTKYTVSNDLDVASQSAVVIPNDVVPGVYQFVATEVGNDSTEYARSNDITINPSD